MSLSKTQIQKILEAINEVYEKAGKKLETAVLVDDIVDDEVVGEVLIDNRKDLN